MRTVQMSVSLNVLTTAKINGRVLFFRRNYIVICGEKKVFPSEPMDYFCCKYMQE